MSWNLLYGLDLFAISLFTISYYRNCYRRGYRIDFWHWGLFSTCVLPGMFMLPFARSELNATVLRSDYASVVEALPAVFLISLTGYFAILVGGSLWSFRSGLGIRRAAVSVLDIIPRGSMMLMSSRSLLVFQASLCLSLQVLVLAIYFGNSGFGFNLRDYTFANPTLRPVTQTVSFYSVILGSHCLARYIDKKERVLLACTLLLSFGLVFFGARSNLLNIYLTVGLCYLVKLRKRVSLFRTAAAVVAIVLFALYLGSARAGEYSLTGFFSALIFLLFFGNNFSDLRDFGWVYAKWDHVFWGGKTYLAALMAFIPRFASEFRDTWGLGAATSLTVGFDPHQHPGLRPGSFGEGFFNFGLLGVIAVGMIGGIILRRLDTETKLALAPPRPSMMRAYAATMMGNLGACVALSVNTSLLYVLCGIYLFSWLCLRVLRLVQPRSISLAGAD